MLSCKHSWAYNDLTFMMQKKDIKCNDDIDQHLTKLRFVMMFLFYDVFLMKCLQYITFMYIKIMFLIAYSITCCFLFLGS